MCQLKLIIPQSRVIAFLTGAFMLSCHLKNLVKYTYNKVR
ncbi:hypothetical protein BH09BAC4_BH09BAC4_27650 [soil metagenome]